MFQALGWLQALLHLWSTSSHALRVAKVRCQALDQGSNSAPHPRQQAGVCSGTLLLLVLLLLCQMRPGRSSIPGFGGRDREK